MLPTLVLCGGLGTRLLPVLDDRPKVLAPIAGAPFLHHLLTHLHHQGVTDVVLATGHLGDQVEAFAGEAEAWDLRLRCVREPAPLGTAGALRFAAEAAGIEGPFLALNGDTFFYGSLRRLLAYHRARPDAVATLALVQVADGGRYGTVQAPPLTGAVTAFAEKDETAPGPAWINAGAYILTPPLLYDLPTRRNVSLERDVFPHWIGKGLYGCPFPGAAFLDIGTPEDYARAEELLRANP